MQQKYFSTKRIGPISTGHRQWRDTGHCQFVHGYGRYVEVTFACTALDERGWVVDFGSLKGFKKWLETQWDHRVLISTEDPNIDVLLQMQQQKLIDINVVDAQQGHGPGIEQSCKMVYDYLDPLIRSRTDGRCWIHSVRIWEHENNSAMLVIE